MGAAGRGMALSAACVLSVGCVLAAGCVVGCVNRLTAERGPEAVRDSFEDSGTGDDETLSGGESVPGLSGTIRMAGSTSMEKLADALAESFMKKYPNVTVTVEYVGSGAGIQAVLSGMADIGNSSRALSAEEQAGGAVGTVVALDGIAVCTDPANAVRELTKGQLKDIYTGAVTNWSEVGGEDFPIVVVGHQAGSGTRDAFEEFLGAKDVCSYSNELGSSGAVLAKVASTPGAIGYVSLDVTDDSVAVLALEGVTPAADNIREGSYLLSRPFLMVTGGELCRQSRLVQAWFDYVLSEEGRAVTERMGLVPVDEKGEGVYSLK